jgi:thioredoxin-dependent peroxiredoxin
MTEKWIGKSLPKIKLPVTTGDTISLPDDIKGKWTVLYFYPKDSTPGCTKQACNYQANISKFKKMKAVVYGVSLDDLKSHEKFQNKFDLKFPLISDPDHKLSEKLGVYGEKKFMGKKYMGLSRDTFLIDDKGKIRKVWRKVKPDVTVDETAQAIKELQS